MASFAQAPNRRWWPAARRPGSSPCPRSAPAATPRRWPTGAWTPSSPRAARVAATPAPCHDAPAPPGRRGRGRPRARAGRRGLLQRARPGGRPGLWRRRRGHGDPLPPLGREPGARRGEGAVPRHTGDGHRGDDQGRRGAPARRAHRSGRPPGVPVAAARAHAHRCTAPTASARSPGRPSPRCCARAAP